MDSTKESVISTEHLTKAMEYDQYRKLIDNLLEENKTTGENHSEDMIHYTQMNVQRMNRIEKTVDIYDDTAEVLKNIGQKWVWVVMTEAWCGDAAQNIPIIAKMADLSPNIDLKLLLRDENLDVMDQYLTNGGRSIPKMIALKTENLDELGTWGPRPAPAQEMMNEFKANPNGRTKQDLIIDIQKWYTKDKGRTLQNEFIELIKSWQ